MSQRGKRQVSRTDDGPVPTKRRKGRPPVATVAEEEEAPSLDPGWTPRPINDLKISSIYNRSATEAPAELFRKDLISAMKLPDSEPLGADEYWTITDQWKQEWERGVQVPVNPDSLPGPVVTMVSHAHPPSRNHQEFKLPKNKYIRITKDEMFKAEDHVLSSIPAKAEKACSYDLDDCDIAWLHIYNGERAQMGLQPLKEEQLERIIEELEIRCWDKVQTIVKAEEGLGIEFDENVICDVCRSPDSEEGNEMVFCDNCNICVHQACYGITAIPAGSWLCRTCALGLRPECVLCPNKGGAMKCTRSGHKWAHVSCALWIPEVSIGCVERMEPITKISSIPQSRWALICVLCRERVGACIQCSVKTCKTAYHVTCAFKHGLEMRAIIEDENADDGVKLRSYCQKHSLTSKRERNGSGSEDEECKRKKRKDMTSEEKNQARAAKLQEIEAEFQKHVSVSDVTHHHDVDHEGITAIYNYWVLKRRAGFNKPLLAPRSEDVDILTRQQEQADLEKMRMFVQLRQDLERVRNLCYMVSRREKLSRTFFRMREQTFHKQVSVLSDPSYTLSSTELTAVKEANHGPSIYDRLYSHPAAPELSTDFETVLARIAGIASPTPEDKGKIDLNGVIRTNKTENPFKRMYINGGAVRPIIYGSMSSGSETDTKRSFKMEIDSAVSSADEKHGKSTNKSCAVINKDRRLNKKRPVTRTAVGDTSSEDEEVIKPTKSSGWQSSRSRSLRQMEKELANKSGPSDDSDDILPFKTTTKNEPHKIHAIYSDSESETSQKEDNAPSDSQMLVMRTKAAVKEFSAGNVQYNKGNKHILKGTSKNIKNDKEAELKLDSSLEDDYQKDKENIKGSRKKEQKDSVPSELIVPQRQAAKKATESIRSSHGKTKGEQMEQDIFRVSPTSQLPQNQHFALQSPTHAQSSDDTKSRLNKIRSRENRDSKHNRENKHSNDIYEFDKESGDNQEILAYVPQRQAAKKAAEHIKSGLHKPVAVENEMDSAKLKSLEPGKVNKKELDSTKVKKEQENNKVQKVSKPSERRGQRTPKSSVSTSSSSSSSTSGSCTSSSSSESDEAEDTLKKPLDKKHLFDSPQPKVLNKDSPEKKFKPLEKKNILKKVDDVSHEKETSESSSSSTSSSSSSESENESPPRDKINVQRKSTDSISSRSKTIEILVDRDSSNSKMAAAKKFKKLPDKKLKTSDGRPELEFQQPPIEREESARSKDKSNSRRKTGSSSSDRYGTSQTKHGNPVSKTPSPVTTTKSSSRSCASRVDEGSKSSLDRKSDSLPKKDYTKQDGRKRKSNDFEKNTSTAKISVEPVHSSGISEPEHENIRKEKGRPQHSPVTSKKTDKKIDLKTNDIKRSISPGNKSETESLASKLEREISERKAERDITGKNTSKKSLDKLFEKRDKLFQSRNEIEISCNSEQSGSKKESQDKYSGKMFQKEGLKLTDKCSLKDINNQYKNKESPKKSSSRIQVDNESENGNIESIDFKISKTQSSSEVELKNSPSLHRDILENKLHENRSISDITSDNKYNEDHVHGHMSGVDENRSKHSLDSNRPDSENSKKIKSLQKTKRIDSTHESIINSKENIDYVCMTGDKYPSLDISVTNDNCKTNEILTPVDPESEEHIDSYNSSTIPVLSPAHIPQHTAPTLKLNLQLMPNIDKAGGVDIPCSDFHVADSEIETKKISSRTSSLSAPPPYQQRSIFSPQPPQSKDSAVAELFDFENDILAVDETVNEDGFGIARDSDEMMRAPPLTFSFSSEFLFKEDSKEDSARETLNLVEKLRSEYAKKTSTQSDVPESNTPVSDFPVVQPEEEMIDESKEELIEPSVEEEVKPDICQETNEIKELEGNCTVNSIKPDTDEMSSGHIEIPVDHNNLMQPHEEEKHEIPQYETNEPYIYQSCPVAIDVEKVPGREKLDRSNSAQADERWVPPSVAPQHYEPMASPYTEMHNRNKWADSEVLPSRRSSSSSASSTCSQREEVDPGKREDLILAQPTPNLLPEIIQFPNLHPPMAYGCSIPDAQPPTFHSYSETSPYVGPVALFPAPPPTCSQLQYSSPGAAALFPPSYTGSYAHSLLPKPSDEQIHIPSQTCTAAFTSSSHNMALTAAMVSPNPPLTPVAQEQPLTPAPFSESCSQLPPQNLPPQLPPPQPPVPLQPTLPLQQQQQTTLPPPPPPLPPPESPVLVQNAETFNHQPPAPVPEEPVTTSAKNTVGKKSPAKPTRTSARVVSQQGKSPGKSPGISPRQSEMGSSKSSGRVRETSGKRGKSAGNRGGGTHGRGGRGRGRGRGRGGHVQHHFHHSDPDPNTIHSKLVGTVYDFDFDEECSENVENLRAMRERRRSTDVHERKSSDSSFLSRDSSPSPKFTSPHHNSKMRSSYAADIRDLRPPTPANDIQSTVEEDGSAEPSRVESFPDVVQPLLPGPVDMRTYSSYEPTSTSSVYHNNLIGTFTTGSTTDHQDFVIDDLEKQIDSYSESKAAVEERNKQTDEPLSTDTLNDSSLSSNKVSLSDSRNQLKVKIKGPFLDANYTSSVVPTSQPVLPPMAPGDAAISSMVGSASAVTASGTSNLRRMRKKELLRQYWTQDMNMDEAASAVVPGQVMPPTAAPPLNRTVITIPKAVASMTSIPTREDYKAVVDANMEKKRRKEKTNTVGEIVTLDYDEESERRRSMSGNTIIETSHPSKRRGRQPRGTPTVSAPKLKIKIGGGTTIETSVSTVHSNDDRKNLRERPPKKRLSSGVPMPTVEELKRESMKFRRMVMADFDEEEKMESLELSGYRRKKRVIDETPQVQVIAPDEAAPKLIIRFGKRSKDSVPPPPPSPPPQPEPPPPTPVSPHVNTSETDFLTRTSECSALRKVRTSKTTPIRLKLSRCEEGYVMKTTCEPLTNTIEEAEQPCAPSPASSSLTLSQDCEVR